jgi:hypothetical protein
LQQQQQQSLLHQQQQTTTTAILTTTTILTTITTIFATSTTTTTTTQQQCLQQLAIFLALNRPYQQFLLFIQVLTKNEKKVFKICIQFSNTLASFNCELLPFISFMIKLYSTSKSLRERSQVNVG